RSVAHHSISRASEPHPPAAPSPFKGRPARAEVVISFTEAAFATFFFFSCPPLASVSFEAVAAASPSVERFIGG
ncbi:hypothetical protein, partial [Inquilinus ginsengisoli]|uniref:hypothetical protein n=1 Tax=Inquilinus ginsengisoli TaxID=363840 RepID=UPI00286C92C1